MPRGDKSSYTGKQERKAGRSAAAKKGWEIRRGKAS